MRRVLKVIISTALLLSVSSIVFLFDTKAEAATSSWQKIEGSCYGRVWTDATTYTKRATSIDAYAEIKGKCGKLNYRMLAGTRDGEYYIGGPTFKGSLTKRTPIKKFYFSKFYPQRLDERWDLNVEFYKGKKFIGAVQSKIIYIKKRV
ncbi:hypothetical protein P9D53_15510 [Bacillus haynesii]|uniref:hypothetical protein n=1 Tax=Bacillus haynesii TaxID=1925021 RepID=UPI0022832D3F|nr:hypothetical protein [Bacillus haynesii]MCY8544177.1 hypothetical protein [Bacillus haynesii]MEC1359684.1 hypothetical protein [Bacillus haynesii]